MTTDLEISPVRRDDAATLARLHRAAFPDFFLSQLGEPFLRQFYLGFVDDVSAITAVARDSSGRAVGAVVGTSEPSGFYRRLLRRRLVGLGVASLRAAIRRPSSITRLVRGALYRGGVGDQPAPAVALLSSICVAPETRGTGLGRALLVEWEQAAARAGVTAAHLSTDRDDNDLVRGFYSRAGWSADVDYVTREGRRMTLYRKDIS